MPNESIFLRDFIPTPPKRLKTPLNLLGDDELFCRSCSSLCAKLQKALVS